MNAMPIWCRWHDTHDMHIEMDFAKGADFNRSVLVPVVLLKYSIVYE